MCQRKAGTRCCQFARVTSTSHVIVFVRSREISDKRSAHKKCRLWDISPWYKGRYIPGVRVIELLNFSAQVARIALRSTASCQKSTVFFVHCLLQLRFQVFECGLRVGFVHVALCVDASLYQGARQMLIASRQGVRGSGKVEDFVGYAVLDAVTDTSFVVCTDSGVKRFAKCCPVVHERPKRAQLIGVGRGVFRRTEQLLDSRNGFRWWCQSRLHVQCLPGFWHCWWRRLPVTTACTVYGLNEKLSLHFGQSIKKVAFRCRTTRA